VSEDEGFVEALPSPITSSSWSITVNEHHGAEPDDIWTAALHHKLDRHYTWESVGRYDLLSYCLLVFGT